MATAQSRINGDKKEGVETTSVGRIPVRLNADRLKPVKVDTVSVSLPAAWLFNSKQFGSKLFNSKQFNSKQFNSSVSMQEVSILKTRAASISGGRLCPILKRRQVLANSSQL